MRSTRVSSWARLVITAETCGMLGHAGERRAALEVDQHHVELLGGVRHRQPEHQRAQELRLAGAGRADHQAVRAHALLGRLLDVEVHDRAALAEADRHPQPVARRPRPPGPVGVEAVHVAEREQLHEVGGAGDLAAGALDHAADRVQRGEPARERLGGGERALVGLGPDRLLAQPQRLDRVPAVARPRAVVVELDAQPGRVLELVPARRQVEQGDAVQAVRRYDVVAGRQLAAVDHQQQVRGRRPLVGAEPGPLGRGPAGSSAARSASDVDTIRIGPTASDCWALWACGQPLHPVPVGEVLLRGEHRDDEVLGGVEGGRRADQRPGQRAGRLLGAADLDPVEGAQVDRGGQVGLEPVHDEQPVQRGRGGRVDLVDGRALGRHQLERERLRAHAVPDVQEAGVAVPCSQTRERSSASAGSAAGSGWCQVSARRCWSAASRATLRTLAR